MGTLFLICNCSVSIQLLLIFIILLKVKIYFFNFNHFKINANVKSAIKRLVDIGGLKQVKGIGANGSFRIGEKAAKPKKVAKKPKNAVSQPKAPKAKKAKVTIKKVSPGIFIE